MNVTPFEKQIQIVSALVEGNSIRATARMVGVEHKTVLRVLLRRPRPSPQLLPVGGKQSQQHLPVLTQR